MKPDPGHTFRANGLDTLRAAAITLVFMNHYMAFVSGTPTFGWGSVIGWTVSHPAPGTGHRYRVQIRPQPGLDAAVRPPARLLQPLDTAPFVMTCTIAIASVLVGALLYRLVEAPFMAIRDRLFPTSFAQDPGRPPLSTQPAAAQTPGSGVLG